MSAIDLKEALVGSLLVQMGMALAGDPYYKSESAFPVSWRLEDVRSANVAQVSRSPILCSKQIFSFINKVLTAYY